MHPMKKFDTWNSWSSWSSPVGLGIFFLTTALAGAIALYALLNLLGTALSLARPEPSQAQMMQYAPQQDSGATMTPGQ